MLPNRSNNTAFPFRNKRECRLCQLVRVRLHQYSWHFLLNDFRRLVQQLELEEEARRANEQPQQHRRHHRHTSPTKELEEEKSTKTKKPVKGRHHHKK
ncbi:hypothetical protein BV898_12771 [Hypsibius exemplaris]|uniref:Uncharacterized protein n=1 Tax=Hypsibius exemplaris TaxID=2072580 RepID=A0A1W0WCX2_HYPEX|nr:hypothetical protein BV898_12771 [Hypsibius exemplaris]